MKLLMAQRLTDGGSNLDPHRRGLFMGLGLAALGLSGCATRPDEVESEQGAVPDAVVPFSASRADGGLPRGWRPYVMRRDLPRTVYRTAQDKGRTVLHAAGTGTSSGLQCPVDIDPLAKPLLRWQWRVDQVNTRATLGEEDAADTVSRIIVGFEGDKSRLSLRDRMVFEQVELFTGHVLPFATLMYVWDGQLPVEHVHVHPRTGRVRYIVAETGTRNAGKWLSIERDVVADYTRVYGEPPTGRISSVGVLTDSDNLKQRAEAWYGDIAFHGKAGGVA